MRAVFFVAEWAGLAIRKRLWEASTCWQPAGHDSSGLNHLNHLCHLTICIVATASGENILLSIQTIYRKGVVTTNALDALIEASTDMFIKLQDLLLHSGFTVRSLIVIVYILSHVL